MTRHLGQNVNDADIRIAKYTLASFVVRKIQSPVFYRFFFFFDLASAEILINRSLVRVSLNVYSIVFSPINVSTPLEIRDDAC